MQKSFLSNFTRHIVPGLVVVSQQTAATHSAKMQPANANGIQVVFVQQPNWMTQGGQPPQINISNGFSKKFITLGSLHIAFGALCVIFQAVSMGISATSYYSPALDFAGYGFWTGVLFIVTGPFGIVSGQRKSKGYVIVFNVLSILSASFAAVLLSLAIPSAATPFSRRYFPYDRRADSQIAAVVMDSFLAILAVAEGIVAILSSVFSCKVGACCKCCDCCNCCECCCPPSNYVVQSAVPSQLIGQSIEAQQQPIVLYSTSNQQQFPLMANQQPMFYAMAASDQQLMIDQSVQQQRGQEHSDRDKLVE